MTIHHGSRCIAFEQQKISFYRRMMSPNSWNSNELYHLQDSEKQLVDVQNYCLRGNMNFKMLQCNRCCPKFCWVMSGEWTLSILMIGLMLQKTLSKFPSESGFRNVHFDEYILLHNNVKAVEGTVSLYARLPRFSAVFVFWIANHIEPFRHACEMLVLFASVCDEHMDEFQRIWWEIIWDDIRTNILLIVCRHTSI